MARKVEGVQGETFEYVPKCFDNDKDPEPIVVRLSEPTERERRKLQAQLFSMRSSEDTSEDEQISFYESVVETRVLGFAGGAYEVMGRPIKTAKDLIEYGETLMLLDVGSHVVLGQLVSDDEKKS